MQNAKPLPSQEKLQKLFLYDPNTGKLFRRRLDASHFSHVGFDPQAAANNYNSKSAGREAFTSSDRRGYRHGKVFQTNYQAHRIIWKLVHGEDPVVIDHIEAARAYDRAARILHGEFATLNFPEEI